MDRIKPGKIALSIYFFFLVSISFLGCSTFNFFENTSIFSGDKKIQYDEDELKLQKWEADLENKNYLQVSQEIPVFLRLKPASQHWYAILFTLGKAKEGLEDWTGAVESYREIIERSSDRQMEFVALASYRIAYCEEVLLENEKALAALSDAYRLKVYLPLEISLAEIPARIASVHSRLNQTQLADTYTMKAEKGLGKLRAIKKGSDPEWVSRTLVRMGSLSLNQIDPESFQQNIMTLTRNQKYLLQAIEINQAQWSKRAQEMMLSLYTTLWSFIENYKSASSADWESDVVAESQKKSYFLSIYLESIEKLKSYRAPEESPGFLVSEPLFQKISELEAKALALLNTEMLKKPWNLQQAQAPEFNSSNSLPAKEIKTPSFENEKRPDYIPTQLPKKKEVKR